MKPSLLLFTAGLLLSPAAAHAASIGYNTTGSNLSCGAAAGCAQLTANSVAFGGLTISYNSGSMVGVSAPSIISLGTLVTTGTGTNVNLTGLSLVLNINAVGIGSGTLPAGVVSGQISTNNSGASITFAPSNTTTQFGTLPGVVMSAGGLQYTFQVLNPILGIQAPAAGNPVGVTGIQGDVTVTGSAAPEPMTALLTSAGLGALAFVRRRRIGDTAALSPCS
jgi:hypothetical protein